MCIRMYIRIRIGVGIGADVRSHSRDLLLRPC